MWIWEGYFAPAKKEQFLACAEKLRHINPHVIQDIEDFLLLEGLKGKKPIEIKKLIENDHNQKKHKKKNKTKEEEEEEKKHDQRRPFLNMMRPPYYWNFFDDAEEQTPHVLRPDADPRKCYIDKRVESILEDIQQIGFHLTMHEQVRWKTLRNFTVEIFKHESKNEHAHGDDDKK